MSSSNLPANPIQGLIRRAAQTLPAATGEVARFSDRMRDAGIDHVILADVSSSMAESAGARTKFELLRAALAAAYRPGIRLVAFSSTPTPCDSPAALPDPAGSTALHLALSAAATLRPRRTLVISDGQPDNRAAALEAARELPGLIDVLFVGPDSDKDAIAFMRQLASIGGGRVVVRDIKRTPDALPGVIRTLLPAPESGK